MLALIRIIWIELNIQYKENYDVLILLHIGFRKLKEIVFANPKTKFVYATIRNDVCINCWYNWRLGGFRNFEVEVGVS